MISNKVADEKVTTELVNQVDKKEFSTPAFDKTNNSGIAVEKDNKNLETVTKPKNEKKP